MNDGIAFALFDSVECLSLMTQEITLKQLKIALANRGFYVGRDVSLQEVESFLRGYNACEQIRRKRG